MAVIIVFHNKKHEHRIGLWWYKCAQSCWSQCCGTYLMLAETFALLFSWYIGRYNKTGLTPNWGFMSDLAPKNDQHQTQNMLGLEWMAASAPSFSCPPNGMLRQILGTEVRVLFMFCGNVVVVRRGYLYSFKNSLDKHLYRIVGGR